MHLSGLPDGLYPWGPASTLNASSPSRILKTGPRLTLEGSPDKIAGSSISLVECVNNFLKWSGVGIAKALKAVTGTPARMLGLEGVKGTLEEEADADLVIFSEEEDGEGGMRLVIDQVWKFGSKVFEKEG
jgi:N-acetylglucosamine-6-phosphate deacetylase